MYPGAHTTETILAAPFRSAVRLGAGHSFGSSAYSRVLRFPVIDGPPFAPASVIVKQRMVRTLARSSPSESVSWLIFNDWAGLQCFGQLVPSPLLVPSQYGGDGQAVPLVMKDVRPGIRLDHVLMGSDPVAAEVVLVAYVELHGRLYALTGACYELDVGEG